MILHAQQGIRGRVIDLDTGERVPKVIWFDTERQEVEAFQIGRDGLIERNPAGEYKTVRLSGRFKFVPTLPKPSISVNQGSPVCALCGSPLVLMGKELCPKCNAQDKGHKNLIGKRLDDPFLIIKCDHKGCSRQAEWAVGDEVIVTPQRKTDRIWFDRGATVGQRHYCSFHFQAPRVLDEKGEVVKVEEDSARPD